MSPLLSRGGESGDGGRISYEEFSAAIKSCGYPAPMKDTYSLFITEARNFKMFDKQELAMILAQFIHESNGFFSRREKVNLEHYPQSYKDPECDEPGQMYYGRGYLKLRFCKNYRDISMDLYNDDRLVKKPESLILDEESAMKAGFAYWARQVKSFPGVSEGQFGATTNALNGPSECYGGGAPSAKKRYEIYKQVRKAFNLKEASPNAEQGCYEVNQFMNESKQLPKA